MGITCCNDKQTLTIVLVVLYAVLILKLWRVAVLHPFKILTIFLHELCHAVACWLTCGKVESLEVHPNEGGVTKTSGGIQWIILSAGYVGSALVGMALIITSASIDGARVAACVLMFFLAIFALISTNRYLRILNLGSLAFFTCLLVIDIFTKYKPLWYATIFMGVMSSLFPIYDIWDNVLARRTNESDTSALASATKMSSVCWNVVSVLVAVAAVIVGVILNLRVSKREGWPVKLSQTATRTQVLFGVSIAVVVVCVVHTAITRRIIARKRSFGGPTSGNFYVSAV